MLPANSDIHATKSEPIHNATVLFSQSVSRGRDTAVLSPLSALAAGADDGVVRYGHGEDAVPPHGAEELNRLLPLIAPLAGADDGRVDDGVRCKPGLTHLLFFLWCRGGDCEK